MLWRCAPHGRLGQREVVEVAWLEGVHEPGSGPGGERLCVEATSGAWRLLVVSEEGPIGGSCCR